MKTWKRIVWIASYPKSGSTWLRCFFDAYYCGRLDINALLASSPDDCAAIASVCPKVDFAAQPIDIALMGRQAGLMRMAAWDRADGGDLPMLVKTHCANMVIDGTDLIPEPLTRAIIHLVRHPADVLPSFAAHMGLDIDAASEQMRYKRQVLYGPDAGKLPSVISSWGAHADSYLKAKNTLTVRYEDLKEAPAAKFAEILRFLGEEPDMDRLAAAVEMVSIQNLRRMEDEAGFKELSHKQKTAFFGGERPQASPAQRRALVRAFLPEIRRLGYSSAPQLRSVA